MIARNGFIFLGMRLLERMVRLGQAIATVVLVVVCCGIAMLFGIEGD